MSAALLWSAAFLMTGVASAADIAAGKQKAEAVCQTCHGMNGVATLATTPNIGGQQRDYIVIQLEAYRSGKRQHLQMSTVAQPLTDADIENLAEWYSSIKFTFEMPE